ncbi:glutamate racemase [Croceibacterium aestuarii]|uniref:glutamate racemase n=1 Tax=Croceibacterium aestuarii TaxID=3064139 RepID=UPI00272E3D5F|nr:glutamate racemase [Croceibacterium sp. D39]
MDATAPILIFDSGVGGLTVLAEIRKLLPNAPLIYAADLAGLPYGEKSEAEIAARVAGLLGRMSERFRPRLITIACNTASTIALGMVREVLEVPIVGTVPAIKPAALQTQSGVVGLLGTSATIRQKYVDDLEANFAGGKVLLRHACPALVSAAEQKLRGEVPEPAVFRAAAQGLRGQPRGEEIDTVVLACTHFPLVEDELRAALGPGVEFIHGAEGIARRVAHLTQDNEFHREKPDFAVVTGPIDAAAGLDLAFREYGLEAVAQF